MAQVGTGQVARLQLPVYDVTTVATLQLVSPPDASGVRTTTDIEVSADDGGHIWTGDIPPYPVPGLWSQVWTVTGTGTGRLVHTVEVEADPLTSVGRSYASTADLANWLRAPLPDDAERMLAAATREVDVLMLSSIYLVDTDGNPTDPVQRRAMADAVCELVSWWLDTGDESGALSIYAAMSAGSVSVSRGRSTGTSGGRNSRVSQQVLDILTAAGLLRHRPVTW